MGNTNRLWLPFLLACALLCACASPGGPQPAATTDSPAAGAPPAPAAPPLEARAFNAHSPSLPNLSKGSYGTVANKYLLPYYAENDPVEVYCGCTFDPGTKEVDVDTCRFNPKEPRRDDAVRGARIEWEHVVPAARLVEALGCTSRTECRKNPDFVRAENDPNNLLPALGVLNARRSDHPYGEVNGEPRVFGTCDFEKAPAVINGKNETVYEPPNDLKGDAARISPYFANRYGVE